MKYEINPDWEEYYKILENIRKAGFTNMWGASTYLEEWCDLNKQEASKILCSWIENYSELSKKYGWQ